MSSSVAFSHTSAISRLFAFACASSAPTASPALLLPKIRLETGIDVSIAVVAACGVCADGVAADGVAAAEGAAVEEAVGKAVVDAKGGSFDDPAGCAAAAGVSLGRPSTTLEVYQGSHAKFNKLPCPSVRLLVVGEWSG